MKITFFAAFVALVLGIGTLGTVDSALAAPGNGATVVNEEQCDVFGSYTYCFEQKGVSNQTTTPSGNINYVFNGKSTWTVSDSSGVLYSSESDGHYRLLIKDGVVHVISGKSGGSFTFGSTTCTYEYAYHYANGEVRRSVENFVCV